MALVHYVQSLGKFDRQAGKPQDMEALAKELATAGETVPNKIPVSMAMTKISEEYMAPPPLDPGREDQSRGAEILRRVILDPARAGRFLRASQSWRSSYQALALSVVPGSPSNGFSINSATLNNSEWRELYGELLKRVKLR
jgi:hypothetical protein